MGGKEMDYEKEDETPIPINYSARIRENVVNSIVDQSLCCKSSFLSLLVKVNLVS
jgi:hypothetical protein